MRKKFISKVKFDEEAPENTFSESAKRKANETQDASTEVNDTNSQPNSSPHKARRSKQKRKRTKKTKKPEPTSDPPHDTEITNTDETESSKPKPKKRKKRVEDTHEETVETAENTALDGTSVPKKKETESIRSQKRKKYALLLEEKRRKSEHNIQQKCLNYLSLWKHSRSEWKFKKLVQIWLQHNMFDEVLIPDAFWDTLVQYFSSCKGQVRDLMIKDSIKIIETDQNTPDGEDDTNVGKLKRARDIVQYLQE